MQLNLNPDLYLALILKVKTEKQHHPAPQEVAALIEKLIEQYVHGELFGMDTLPTELKTRVIAQSNNVNHRQALRKILKKDYKRMQQHFNTATQNQ
ncbi:hypothetical protein ACONG6_003550 [Vibrio cholerae]